MRARRSAEIRQQIRSADCRRGFDVGAESMHSRCQRRLLAGNQRRDLRAGSSCDCLDGVQLCNASSGDRRRLRLDACVCVCVSVFACLSCFKKNIGGCHTFLRHVCAHTRTHTHPSANAQASQGSGLGRRDPQQSNNNWSRTVSPTRGNDKLAATTVCCVKTVNHQFAEDDTAHANHHSALNLNPEQQE